VPRDSCPAHGTASERPGTFADVNDPGKEAVEKFEQETVDKRRVSDHLVRGIDFLFALTLGQGILLYHAFWTDPLHHRYIPVALALCSVYITTFLSFIDWHLAMEHRPYLVTWDLQQGHERLRERVRVFIDLGIVILYAYLLINATVLITDPGHSLSHFLIGYPLIFALYVAWNLLRHQRYPNASAVTWALGSFAFIFTVIYAGYIAIGNSGEVSNDITLGIVILAILVYRLVNGIVRKHSDSPVNGISTETPLAPRQVVGSSVLQPGAANGQQCQPTAVERERPQRAAAPAGPDQRSAPQGGEEGRTGSGG
jgi:hypothetical protein